MTDLFTCNFTKRRYFYGFFFVTAPPTSPGRQLLSIFFALKGNGKVSCVAHLNYICELRDAHNYRWWQHKFQKQKVVRKSRAKPLGETWFIKGAPQYFGLFVFCSFCTIFKISSCCVRHKNISIRWRGAEVHLFDCSRNQPWNDLNFRFQSGRRHRHRHRVTNTQLNKYGFVG